LVGLKLSREAFAVLGVGITKARALKKLIINQTNIASYGLQELANGFAISSSIEYLDLQQNDLNDSHGWTLSKIIST
jgi:Ran GTPase-activating protein (RanGAP) involved in mRNA processing and transport